MRLIQTICLLIPQVGYNGSIPMELDMVFKMTNGAAEISLDSDRNRIVQKSIPKGDCRVFNRE